MSIPAPFANHAARVEFVRTEKHITSMCLEIADFTHEDCIAAHCRCECHSTNQPIGEVPC